MITRSRPARSLLGRCLPGSLCVLFFFCAFRFFPVVSAQNGAGPLTLLSREGRKAIPLTLVNGREFVGLDDLAAAFQLTVREEAGAITVSYKGRTIVLTPDQALASVAGRLVSLPAPPARAGTRWVVPVEFVSRALAPIYDVRLDLRRPSRLLIVGDLRVPRVTIRHEPAANAARVTIDATPAVTATVAQEQGRLSVKFDADALDLTPPAFQPQGFVQGFRTADAATLGIDLGPRFAAARTSTENIDGTARLVIDLVGAEPAAPSASAAPAAGPPAPSAADLSALSERPTAIRTIAIDPGHGGDDAGVKGPGGTLEKDLTLAVARRLKTAIEGRLGIRVLLTRDGDRSVPLDERTAVANNSKADLFISLHANGSLRPGPTGASIHVAAFNNTQDTPATLTPERVPTVSGTMRDIELVEWELAQIRFLDQSSQMAAIVEGQLRGRVPLATLAVETGPFRVLESANMPAVLIEMGFLSSEQQESQLGGAEFQGTFAQAIVDSVVQFRSWIERAEVAP